MGCWAHCALVWAPHNIRLSHESSSAIGVQHRSPLGGPPQPHSQTYSKIRQFLSPFLANFNTTLQPWAGPSGHEYAASPEATVVPCLSSVKLNDLFGVEVLLPASLPLLTARDARRSCREFKMLRITKILLGIIDHMRQEAGKSFARWMLNNTIIQRNELRIIGKSCKCGIQGYNPRLALA